jgi:hypothetical protein
MALLSIHFISTNFFIEDDNDDDDDKEVDDDDDDDVTDDVDDDDDWLGILDGEVNKVKEVAEVFEGGGGGGRAVLLATMDSRGSRIPIGIESLMSGVFANPISLNSSLLCYWYVKKYITGILC